MTAREVKQMTRVSDFTERFNELMRGTTVTQASDFLGIGKATVSSYMSGVRTAKASFLQHIADAYGVEVLWLMGYDVPKYKETPGKTEGLSEDRQHIIDWVMRATDDEVRALRAIADQVLALRGK
jgi:transcriptional regulator with XRE-family HTH domain